MKIKYANMIFLLILFLSSLSNILASESKLEDKKAIAINESFNISKEDLPKIKKEALLGSSEAAFKLFNYYELYLYDVEQMMYWLTIAAENGHVYAQYHLAFFLNKISTPESKFRAKFWAKKAQKNGVKEAKELLQELEKE